METGGGKSMKWRVFSCDLCDKYTEKFDESEGNPFPYDDGWIYIHSVDLKYGIGLGNVMIIKDRHFCSLACAIEFIRQELQNRILAKKGAELSGRVVIGRGVP
jgi:hypothetical protein